MLCLKKGGGRERQRTKEREEKRGSREGRGSYKTASGREERGEALSLLRCPFPWRNKTKLLPPQEKTTAEMRGEILPIEDIFQGNFE